MNTALCITYTVVGGLAGIVVWNAIVGYITRFDGETTWKQDTVAAATGALIRYSIYVHLPVGGCI